MPSRKPLKGVARSFAEAFGHLKTESARRLVAGELLRLAGESGVRELRCDLLTGVADESPLMHGETGRAIERFVAWFPRLVQGAGSAIELIAEAELRVALDPGRQRKATAGGGPESPCVCAVRIVTDRGRIYEHQIESWVSSRPASSRPASRFSLLDRLLLRLIGGGKV